MNIDDFYSPDKFPLTNRSVFDTISARKTKTKRRNMSIYSEPKIEIIKFEEYGVLAESVPYTELPTDEIW